GGCCRSVSRIWRMVNGLFDKHTAVFDDAENLCGRAIGKISKWSYFKTWLYCLWRSYHNSDFRSGFSNGNNQCSSYRNFKCYE
ncbi:MAG: hypothetical protein WAV28_16620, partial [Sedimentisphaerales bacterium]